MTRSSLALRALLLLTLAGGLGCDADPDELVGNDAPSAVPVTSTSSALVSDTLEQFAAKCDQAIGVTVPDFKCDDGSEVPGNDPSAAGFCDQPNRLNQVCDPGSKFQVLTRSDSAYVVAHCRKEGNSPGRFRDIAVIQYSRTNGSTCFYQALGDLSGDVKAPSRGTGAFPWMTPNAVANAPFKCVKCHDNGPIIRSPYLSGVANVDNGKNKLPGDGDLTFNRDQPYKFVGNDFVDWKAFKVEVAGNACNGCHRMGVTTFGGGTSLDFGLRATAGGEQHKNPHSPSSPIWTWFMRATPFTDATYSDAATNQQAQASFASLRSAAEAIRDCAARVNESPLPSSASCKITQYTGVGAPSVPGRFSAVWTRSEEPEIQVYGWTYADYRAKYDQLWNQGWRLSQLQPYVVGNGQVRYNAVWRQSTEGEIQVYGWTYADFRAKYDQLWPQGWRLKILQPYVVNNQVRYTAVWSPSTEGEIQVYGWTYADYRTQYDQLWPQGWRLKLIQPYVVNGEVRYTAVWRPSTEGEIQVYGWTYADYRAQYDQLWPQGWRLKMLRPYVIGGEVRYTAVWRPGSYSETQVYGWSYANFRARYDQLWTQGWRLSSLTAY